MKAIKFVGYAIAWIAALVSTAWSFGALYFDFPVFPFHLAGLGPSYNNSWGASRKLENRILPSNTLPIKTKTPAAT
jgi:hypothetical protein